MLNKSKFAVIAVISMAAFGYATASKSEPKPFVLSPTLSENTSKVKADLENASPACLIDFTSVADERREPQFVGVTYFQGLRAPDDVKAWMQAIVGGLSNRGITPNFVEPSASHPVNDAPAAPRAKFSLKVVWLTPITAKFASNVVITIDAAGANGSTIQRTYRGQAVTMNWNNGAGEMQASIDSAFSDALNKMAPDLRGLCQAQS